MGVGGVGMNSVQAARAIGARAVIAVDPINQKITQVEGGVKLGSGLFNVSFVNVNDVRNFIITAVYFQVVPQKGT